jgi:hypothetical protein
MGEQVEGHDPSRRRGSRSGVFCWKNAGFRQDPGIGRTTDSYNFVEITCCGYEGVDEEVTRLSPLRGYGEAGSSVRTLTSNRSHSLPAKAGSHPPLHASQTPQSLPRRSAKREGGARPTNLPGKTPALWNFS